MRIRKYVLFSNKGILSTPQHTPPLHQTGVVPQPEGVVPQPPRIVWQPCVPARITRTSHMTKIVHDPMNPTSAFDATRTVDLQSLPKHFSGFFCSENGKETVVSFPRVTLVTRGGGAWSGVVTHDMIEHPFRHVMSKFLIRRPLGRGATRLLRIYSSLCPGFSV